MNALVPRNAMAQMGKGFQHRSESFERGFRSLSDITQFQKVLGHLACVPCFKHAANVSEVLVKGSPPDPCIKRKARHGDRYHPAMRYRTTCGIKYGLADGDLVTGDGVFPEARHENDIGRSRTDVNTLRL